MAYRQVAVDGLSERQAVKRMLRLKSVQCDSCRQSIRQGRLYGDVGPEFNHLSGAVLTYNNSLRGM